MVFERTTAPANTVASTNVDWRCKRCGTHHVKNSPPCSSCGHTKFERVELDELGPDEIGGGWLSGLLSMGFGLEVALVTLLLIVAGIAYVLV